MKPHCTYRLTKVEKSCEDRGNARVKGERKWQDSESDEKHRLLFCTLPFNLQKHFVCENDKATHETSTKIPVVGNYPLKTPIREFEILSNLSWVENPRQWLHLFLIFKKNWHGFKMISNINLKVYIIITHIETHKWLKNNLVFLHKYL